MKFHRILYKCLALSVVALLPFGALAQQDKFVKESTDLKDAEFRVEKESVLELPVAGRIYSKMDKIEQLKPDTRQTYELQLVDYELPLLEPQIHAAKMERPYPEILTGNYVKGGVGSYITPYFEGVHSSLRSEKINYSVHAKHLSSVWGPVDKEFSGTSHNLLEGNAKFFTPTGDVSTYLGYDRRMVHFYGYDTLADNLEAKDLKQLYHTVKGGLEFVQNTQSYTPFQFRSGLDFHHLQDRLGARENNLQLHFRSKYELNDEAFIKADLELLFSNRKDEGVNNTRNLFYLSPSYNMEVDKLKVQAGVRIVYNSDSTMDAKSLYFYPDIQATYQVVEDVLEAYGKITGNLHQRTLLDFARENPYLNSRVPLAHANEKLRFEAGVNASPTRKLGLRAGFSFNAVENLHFYVNDTLNRAKFNILYDEGNTNVLNFFAELSADFNPLKGVLKYQFYNYNTKDLAEAWHRPSSEFDLMMQYNHQDFLTIKASAYALSGIKAMEINAERSTTTLDPIFDLNLQGEYKVFENLSAFLAINNIFSQKYQRYLYYNSKGIHALIGAMYTF
ncbi:hypothetical protein AAG747_14625 [Rapidithrix thailandica]|uniref:TonB-dependent receptor n=1 Tax=Rapidithrix thailandica TaxID=413964 RepID=A0AAW9SBK3_9BACT